MKLGTSTSQMVLCTKPIWHVRIPNQTPLWENGQQLLPVSIRVQLKPIEMLKQCRFKASSLNIDFQMNHNVVHFFLQSAAQLERSSLTHWTQSHTAYNKTHCTRYTEYVQTAYISPLSYDKCTFLFVVLGKASAKCLNINVNEGLFCHQCCTSSTAYFTSKWIFYS